MKNKTGTERTEYLTRDTILRLLSDDEVACVRNVETASSLADGDEYVDLEHPDHGIRRAIEKPATPMGYVLPRKVVRGRTWRDVVILLAAHQVTSTSTR